MKRRAPWGWWLAGLALFALVVALSAPLGEESRFGLVDHQVAGSARMVDTIQADWRANGLRSRAIAVMLVDLVFIGVLAFGAWRMGRSHRGAPWPAVRVMGVFLIVCALVFAVTDYLETALQFIQLLNERGSDWMARVAAAMQTPKLVALTGSILGVPLGGVHRMADWPGRPSLAGARFRC